MRREQSLREPALNRDLVAVIRRIYQMKDKGIPCAVYCNESALAAVNHWNLCLGKTGWKRYKFNNRALVSRGYQEKRNASAASYFTGV